MRPGIVSGSTKIQSKEHIISVPKLGGSLLELGDPPRWQHPKPHGQHGLGQGVDQATAMHSSCCFTLLLPHRSLCPLVRCGGCSSAATGLPEGGGSAGFLLWVWRPVSLTLLVTALLWL